MWCNSNCTLTNNRPLIIKTIYVFGTWFRTKNTDFLLVNRPIISDRSLWEISKLLRFNFEITESNSQIFLINKSRQKVWLWPNPCRKCESLPDWWFCLITIWIIQVWIGFPKSFRIGISIHPFGSSTVFSKITLIWVLNQSTLLELGDFISRIPLLMLSDNVEDIENDDRWLADLYSLIIHQKWNWTHVRPCWKPGSNHLDHFRKEYQFLMVYNFRLIYNHKIITLQWQLLFVLKKFQNVAIQLTVWYIPKLTNYLMRLVAIRLPISICTLVTEIFNAKTSFTRTKNTVWFMKHANFLIL